MTVEARFREHLGKARLFALPGEAVLAVSGGADSVVLLDLLAAAAPQHGVTLVVAHADHGIQAGSRAVAESVAVLARHYDLPFEMGELHLGAGASETSARRARYAWLRELQRRRGARYLVTAHQADDQAETVLLRLLRGSAPAGLAGIPARSRGGLIRPLLPFSRAELRAYAAERGLPVYDDPANEDPRHLRSWLRHALLPLLTRRLGHRVESDLRRLGQQAASDRRAWDQMLELLPELELRFEGQGFAVARGVLADYDPTVAVALLRAAARRVGLALGPARARHVAALSRGQSGHRLDLGAGWVAEAVLDRLVVRAAAAARDERPGNVVVTEASGAAQAGRTGNGERGTVDFGSYRVRWVEEQAPPRLERAGWTTWLTAGGWEIRSLQAGDLVKPLGGVGRRPVRRLLMEARVPRSERSGYPILARGETILWVPGICRSGADVPQPGTRAVRVDVTDDREPQANRRT